MTDYVDTEPMTDLMGYLTPDQVEMMIASARNLRQKLVIRILWRTGMRSGELLLLKWKDVLWEDRLLHVRTLKRRRERYRLVPIDQGTLDLLKKYRLSLRRCKLPCSNDDKIFDLSSNGVYFIVNSAAKRCGIDKVGNKEPHPHHLRHSFCIHYMKSGGDVTVLNRIVDHASLATTMKYLQYCSKDKRDDYDKVWGE